MMFRTRTTSLTEAEVLWLAAQAEDTEDYYALLSERVYGAAMASPDTSTIAELADGAAPGFSVVYGSADRHVAAMVAYAESLTGEHCVDGAVHRLGDYSVWSADRSEGFTVVHRLHAGAKHRAAAAKRTRAGRRATCECGECSKCRTRARVAKHRAKQAAPITGHSLGLPSVHVE